MSMAVTQSQNENLTPSTTVWRENLSFLKLGVAQLDITPLVGIESGVWGLVNSQDHKQFILDFL